MLALLLLEQNDCHVLHGRVQIVHLDELVVFIGFLPDFAVTASLHSVQRSAPAAIVEVDLVSLVEQPFEGTHLADGLDC